jgi:hypothetical protein
MAIKLDGCTKVFKRGKKAHDNQRLYSCANALSFMPLISTKFKHSLSSTERMCRH